MHRSFASGRAYGFVALALALGLPGCMAAHGSGPKAADTVEDADPGTGSEAALGTAKEVDRFLSATPLLAKVGPDLAGQYRKTLEKQKEVTGLRALVASEQTELRDRAKSKDEKAEHEQRLANLKRMAEAGAKSENELEQRLVATAKDRSRKATPRVRATLGPFLSNLRQAVAHAREVNRSGHSSDGASSPDEVLSLEASVLDAMLEGFSHAGSKPDGEAAVAVEQESPRTARPSAPSRPRSTGAVVAQSERPAKTASAGSQEVFSP